MEIKLILLYDIYLYILGEIYIYLKYVLPLDLMHKILNLNT